jgi:hypothetical protein
LVREGGVKIKEASPLLDTLEKDRWKIFKRRFASLQNLFPLPFTRGEGYRVRG